jgi:hypothetical protein
MPGPVCDGACDAKVTSDDHGLSLHLISGGDEIRSASMAMATFIRLIAIILALVERACERDDPDVLLHLPSITSGLVCRARIPVLDALDLLEKMTEAIEGIDVGSFL